MTKKTMPAGIYQRKEFSEYFWVKVNKTDSCWLWTGSKYKNGYGTIRRDGKVCSAHRTSYDLHHPLTKPIAEIEFVVCHRCDTPACVNPNHLFLGTRSDNMKDCVEKDRLNTPNMAGSANPFSQYTENEVRQIRADFATGLYTKTEIAEMYNMGLSTVSDIINRKRWKHI